MKWLAAIGISLCFCAGSIGQTNAPDYEYAPPVRSPDKPSPWLPYGVAGVPEQLLRLIFSPVEWAARTTSRPLSGIGTSPLTSEQPSSGLYPMVGFSPSQGAGLGVGYYDENFLAPSRLFRAEGMASMDDVERVAVSLAMPVSNGRLQCGAGFDRDANNEFFGFGNRTEESDRTFFERIESKGWISWNQPLPAGLALDIGATVHALEFDADGGEDSPRIRRKFALSTVSGFQADPDLVECSLRLSHRCRFGSTNDVSAAKWSNEASVDRFETLSGGDFDFTRYSLSSMLSVPLGKAQREVRLAMRWDEVLPDGRDRVPFVFEPSLGGNTGLRGFARDRFRDQASALVNAEYRIPTWAHAQGIMFYDLGRVFRGSDHLSFSSWRWSAGLGAEVETPSQFHVTITIGFSEEGVQPVFMMTRRFW